MRGKRRCERGGGEEKIFVLCVLVRRANVVRSIRVK